MLDHGVAVETELSDDAHALWPGLDAMERDALRAVERLRAGESFQKIEMPPRAAELAVGDGLQARLFLLVYEFLYLAIFDGVEVVGGDLPLFALLARFRDGGRAQQAADVISAKRRLAPLHDSTSSPYLSCNLHDHGEFGPLFVFRQGIAFLG